MSIVLESSPMVLPTQKVDGDLQSNSDAANLVYLGHA